ncbi:uncharacterized protein SPPG_03505 [Spizellomyces punctatus DAOM BR117]|uniref:UspA domain-containing protein n=1 Tax=Spizellomyces punctatus (strain DAOM BR117) TaxID=645134 RepID=A0A0L0HJS1_SPIPD|nr:uncharacterized protein SPPG_03505 [Spizellomyces punctatus DAOM BR117]KND01711.1 hypothetical protein SPPG_03505 [Spizellomyces punctatus DAOM BR117]|eukprot:XP_016609750.1 hypothetical protein SPPG_03505 [Spizellomyces punctatus DAOM BR117]
MPAPKARVIVVALDHTPTSAHALTYLLDNVVRLGDRLVLVSVGVTEGPEWADVVDAAAGVPDPNLKEAEAQAAALLHDAEKLVKDRFAGNEITVLRRPVTGSSVHNMIVEVCDEVNANLLVMGSRNRPGFKRIILGSVSDECAHRAKCAVLIVKDDRPEEEGNSRWPVWARL